MTNGTGPNTTSLRAVYMHIPWVFHLEYFKNVFTEVVADNCAHGNLLPFTISIENDGVIASDTQYFFNMYYEMTVISKILLTIIQ